MKSVFLAGGLAGFFLAAAAGFWAGRSPDRVFFDASVGCVVGALLFRWFWSVVLRGIRETLSQRHAAANATAKTK